MTSEFAIAVHALVYLNHKHETLSSEALADNVCTNSARIRKVMAKLKKYGLIETKEGLNGGYHTTGETEHITLGQICAAMEAEPVTVSWHSGDPDKTCQVCSGMAGVMDEIYGQLNELCRKYLEGITIRDIDGRIFNTGNTENSGNF